MNLPLRTLPDAVHTDVATLVDQTAAHSGHRVFNMLHLGCAVPLFLRHWEAVRAGRISYRGFDEARNLVAMAAEEFPSLRFIWRQLDSMPRLDADVVFIGPGLFRMCGGGVDQLLANAARGRWSLLIVATVPGVDSSQRESLIVEPRVPVPLDAVAHGFMDHAPARVIAHPDCPVSYAVWDSVS
jgi:hypothetical protein